MRVQVFTTASVFRDLQAEWLQLLSQIPFQSVFFTPQWQENWWQHFGNGRQLHVLTVRSDDGVLQGIAPLMLDSRGPASPRLEFIGDLELCDYFDLLITPAYQQAAGHALAQYLVAALGEALELCLTNLTGSSPVAVVLRDSFAEQGVGVEMDEIETCPAIALPADWESYLALLRSKDRHEMRRKMRRATSMAQLTYTVTNDAVQLDADLETFFGLHRMSREAGKRGFMTEEKMAFFRDMAHCLWPHGWLELAFLQADGVAVAGLCCFTYGSTYAAYNAGYHPDYGQLSAGIVLFADRIHSAIARGFTCFDFLRGNEPYKYRFGATDRPLYQLLVRATCSVPGAGR
jgi:CelD/BcsL family acetyltransferase involved in cellulose biosynthesis